MVLFSLISFAMSLMLASIFLMMPAKLSNCSLDAAANSALVILPVGIGGTWPIPEVLCDDVRVFGEESSGCAFKEREEGDWECIGDRLVWCPTGRRFKRLKRGAEGKR